MVLGALTSPEGEEKMLNKGQNTKGGAPAAHGSATSGQQWQDHAG